MALIQSVWLGAAKPGQRLPPRPAGAACGAGDKPEEEPAACGSACGAADKPEEKPAACGTRLRRRRQAVSVPRPRGAASGRRTSRRDGPAPWPGAIALPQWSGQSVRRKLVMEYFAFQWHITGQCDQRCKHCYIFARRTPASTWTP